VTPQELFTKELKLYDQGKDEHTTFYYNLPYVKDYDLCNWQPLRMFSGNIIKRYQYQLEQPVVIVADPDEEANNELLRQKALAERGLITDELVEEAPPTDQDPINQLFEDQEEAPAEETAEFTEGIIAEEVEPEE